VNPNPGRSLDLQAYDGWPVPNSIDADPSPGAVWLARRGMDAFYKPIAILGPPTGRYNCHGLVFASRRTNIPPAGLPNACPIIDLLLRDLYHRAVGAPQTGDIAVYRDDTGEIIHTGFIVRVESIGSQDMPIVLSKWGCLEECEHRLAAFPHGKCRNEFWRLG
jgi:hypothetical protein